MNEVLTNDPNFRSGKCVRLSSFSPFDDACLCREDDGFGGIR